MTRGLPSIERDPGVAEPRGDQRERPGELSVEEWAEIRTAFERMQAAPPEERPAILGRVAPRLRNEVAELVASSERMGPFLERPRFSIVSDRPLSGDCRPGQRLGAFELRSVLGRGGMSTVYRATRVDGVFDQEVAVKVLRSDLLGAEDRQRFDRERAILARLDHPGIARLLDGGETPEGRPYLVLELIRGEPLDVVCRRLRLDVRDRIRLLLEVCDAIQYAHRNLVVHRDLKPGNILVDRGRARVLDFGIARLIGPDTGSSTATGRAPMTVRYASPEQVAGIPVTTLSDVYSLGVLAHELLLGSSPYSGTDTLALLREIEEGIRIRPVRSAFVAPEELAALRVEREELRRLAEGDLGAVLGRALERSPDRRYASAEHFAADLRAFLSSRPVSARRPTIPYLLRRACSRHRGIVATASASALALAATLGLLVDQHRGALRARERAERTLSVLVDQLALSDPEAGIGRHLRARQLLDHASAGVSRLPSSLAGGVEPRVRAALGRIYGNLGLYDEGEREVRRALDQSLEPDEEIELRLTLARILEARGRTSPAQLENERAMALLAEIDSRFRPGLLSSERDARWADAHLIQAGILRSAGRPREAMTAASAASRIIDRLGDGRRAAAAGVLRAELHRTLGEPSHADRVARHALQRAREALDPADLAITELELARARALGDAGRRAEALELVRRAASELAAAYGASHPAVARALQVDGEVRIGGPDALPVLDRAAEIQRTSFGDVHPGLAETHRLRSRALLFLRRLDEAETARRDAASALGSIGNHPLRAELALMEGEILQARDRGRDPGDRPHARAAEEAYRRAIDLYAEVNPDHERVGRTAAYLAFHRALAGDVDSARRWYRRSRELLEARLGPSHPALGWAHASFAFGAIGRAETGGASSFYLEAEAAARAGLPIVEAASLRGHRPSAELSATLHLVLGFVFAERGHLAEAREELSAAREWISSAGLGEESLARFFEVRLAHRLDLEGLASQERPEAEPPRPRDPASASSSRRR